MALFIANINSNISAAINGLKMSANSQFCIGRL